MFDKEQWQIIGDDRREVLLGVVSNTVFVYPAYGKPYSVCIRVPSGFFSYMRDVLKLGEEEAKARPVAFFLEEHAGLWYLGIKYGSPSCTIDLWSYKKMPTWAHRLRCL